MQVSQYKPTATKWHKQHARILRFDLHHPYRHAWPLPPYTCKYAYGSNMAVVHGKPHRMTHMNAACRKSTPK